MNDSLRRTDRLLRLWMACLAMTSAVSCEGTYLGRRVATFEKTRYWGYLRETSNPASSGQIVIMNERRVKQPDRLQEDPSRGRSFGFDNGQEYLVSGHYTGRTIYDPVADMEVPEFLPSKFEPVARNQ